MATDASLSIRDRLTVLRSPSRFVGSAQNRMDAKGRVSVPADLRRQLDPFDASPAVEMFVCPSFSDAELLCGGKDLLDIVLEMVRTQDVFENRRRKLEKAATALTQRLSFDENGRVVMPKKFREHAQLQGQVAFAGGGAYFTMARGEVADELWDVLAELDEEERDVIRTRGMASIVAKGGRE